MTAEQTKIDELERFGFGPKVMKRIKVCPHCGTVVSREHLACPVCMQLLTKTLYDRYRESHICCERCGTVLRDDSHYCPHCGKAIYLKADGSGKEGDKS